MLADSKQTVYKFWSLGPCEWGEKYNSSIFWVGWIENAGIQLKFPFVLFVLYYVCEREPNIFQASLD